MNTEQEWLDNLKPGDPVIAVRAPFYGGKQLDAVARRTPTGLIVLASGATFKSNGWERGREAFRAARLKKPTPELAAEVHRAALTARLAAVKWDALPLEVLEQVVALLPTEEK